MDAVSGSAAAAGIESMDAGGRVAVGTPATRPRPLRHGRGRDSDRDAESRSESRAVTRILETARRLVCVVAGSRRDSRRDCRRGSRRDRRARRPLLETPPA